MVLPKFDSLLFPLGNLSRNLSDKWLVSDKESPSKSNHGSRLIVPRLSPWLSPALNFGKRSFDKYLNILICTARYLRTATRLPILQLHDPPPRETVGEKEKEKEGESEFREW